MKRFELLLTKIVPYGVVFAALVIMMSIGSQQTSDSVRAPIAAVFNDTSFSVSADQISESYTVANIASSIALPSTATVSENYVTVNAIYESTGTSSTSGTIIDKPTIVDIPDVPRGVVSHVVQEGETIESILAAHKIKGVSNDQVRWSNGLKDEKLTVGATIYLPSVPGIVYTVKEGDTYDGIAEKYKSDYEEILARNDVENTPISKGMLLLLPGGVLEEKERPEYVPPVTVKPRYTRPSTNTGTTNTTITVSDHGVRKGLFMVGSYSYWRDVYNSTKGWGNPGAFGNCTWFAWYWRRANMSESYWLPTGAIGNARSWVSTMSSRGYGVGKTPAYGAVVQTTTSGYGHVGVVVGVNEGVNITIQEMNFAGPNGKFNIVYQSTIDWDVAVRYNYIYGK